MRRNFVGLATMGGVGPSGGARGRVGASLDQPGFDVPLAELVEQADDATSRAWRRDLGTLRRVTSAARR
jgi:hypothetical protein